ncbi:MAG: HAD family hydrolase [Candidatus Avigastranaerophilus sp.]
MISLKTADWCIDDIETVLFDKDGTFIDLHYFWGKMTELRVIEVIKKFGLSPDLFEVLCLYLGYDVKSGKMLKDGITALYSRSKIIEIFKNDLKNHFVHTENEVLEEIFDRVSSEFYQDMQKYTKPIESAVQFIKQVRSKGVKTGIVTSDAAESTLLTLKHFGWVDLFDVVMGRESSPYPKESGEPTKSALNLINAVAKTAVMVGDAPTDYISAKNAGIEKTILVATGQIDFASLKENSPYTVEKLNDIIIE